MAKRLQIVASSLLWCVLLAWIAKTVAGLSVALMRQTAALGYSASEIYAFTALPLYFLFYRCMGLHALLLRFGEARNYVVQWRLPWQVAWIVKPVLSVGILFLCWRLDGALASILPESLRIPFMWAGTVLNVVYEATACVAGRHVFSLVWMVFAARMKSKR